MIVLRTTLYLFYSVIPRLQSNRGNLIEQRSGVSYGLRICWAQYLEIATPPSVVRNNTCGAKN